MTGFKNRLGVMTQLKTKHGDFFYFSLNKLARAGFENIHSLPFCIKILLENLLRNEDKDTIFAKRIEKLANWNPSKPETFEIPFMPSRIILQDFTGVPALVDIAAMRDAAKRLYGDPNLVSLKIPTELVIDHSVSVDYYGSKDSLKLNTEREFKQNLERYRFLIWGNNSFENFRVIPPGKGIIHQVNLEHLARIVFKKSIKGKEMIFPDSLVGLDSHTTMINSAGVVGWGVGGIEAEAVMLGMPYYLTAPDVIGVKLSGSLSKGVAATDLVLTITQILREKGVVGKFVEFFGPGIKNLRLEDRATISNMAPEYGATMGFFPVDKETLNYLKLTGRSRSHIDLIEHYFKEQDLFRTDGAVEPVFSDTIMLDMKTVRPCVAGPRRPNEKILLSEIKQKFETEIRNLTKTGQLKALDSLRSYKNENIILNNNEFKLFHGAVLIAAITSCTNTSNPFAMLRAGLIAKKAVELGLNVKPWVKTSLSPGSRAVTEYLSASGLLFYLENLGFNIVAYGCATCIGNSGPIAKPIQKAVNDNSWAVASVLSGNRNFGGRISPLTQMNFLASPPLVIAFAISGTVDIDFTTEPIGFTKSRVPVFLKDIWPSDEEINKCAETYLKPEMFVNAYEKVFEGSDLWNSIEIPEGHLFPWEKTSTYIKSPPFFDNIGKDMPQIKDITNARALVVLGDSVTTDHISPAGEIPENSPAAKYLIDRGIMPDEFNSYGSRRGNHEIMMRGAFGNIRLKNYLVPEVKGGWTIHLPDGEGMSVYDAAIKYMEDKIPLVAIAGKDYGTGSSRDWAAKGTQLLGIKAVIAESFERIHRSNLICMGVLPLMFKPGENRDSLNLDGREIYDITGIENDLFPNKELSVRANNQEGTIIEFKAIARIDTNTELKYYKHGGILPFMLKNLSKGISC